MFELGIAIDGGKDSLSMAALAPWPGRFERATETVKAPGSLVLSAYVTCPDITKTVTPDLELPETGRILYVDLGGGQVSASVARRWPRSSLRSATSVTRTWNDPALLARAFTAVQELLIAAGIVDLRRPRSQRRRSRDHPVGDGLCRQLRHRHRDPGREASILIALPFRRGARPGARGRQRRVPPVRRSSATPTCPVLTDWHDHQMSPSSQRSAYSVNGSRRPLADMRDLRDLWEATELPSSTATPGRSRIVWMQERRPGSATGPAHATRVPFELRSRPASEILVGAADKIPVAIVREEGSNGDREMASAFYMPPASSPGT